ncbi:MAG TPA: hypothetical protein VG099_29260, partial [Gemmataceae bacterium]|nr:hypothetical protein [Gemmataceae bacterium]
MFEHADCRLTDLGLIERGETVIHQQYPAGATRGGRRLVAGKPAAKVIGMQGGQAAAAIDAGDFLHQPAKDAAFLKPVDGRSCQR